MLPVRLMAPEDRVEEARGILERYVDWSTDND